MKQVLGYKGNLVIKDIPLPLVGPYDVQVNVLYSAYSAGTESARVKAQQKLEFLRKFSSYSAIWSKFKALQFSEIFARFKKFQGFYASVGYSCVGCVTSVGSKVANGVKIGDIVVAGGESATHAEYISVPQGMVRRLENLESIDLRQQALAYLATIPINSCEQILLDRPRNVIIIGGGLVGTLASIYLSTKKVQNTVIDPSKDCIYSKWDNTNLHSLPKELTRKFDAVLITTGALNSFDQYYEVLEREVHINILGESGLDVLEKSNVEELYGKITFCNSFGFGRRMATCELLGKDPSIRLPSTFSMYSNLTKSIDFLNSINLEKLIIERSIKTNEIKVDNKLINVFNYGLKI